nr:putative glutenin containing protein [Salmonid herpesvirus 1]
MLDTGPHCGHQSSIGVWSLFGSDRFGACGLKTPPRAISVGTFPGQSPWAISVGNLRGHLPRAISVGTFPGQSPWAPSQGNLRGHLPREAPPRGHGGAPD